MTSTRLSIKFIFLGLVCISLVSQAMASCHIESRLNELENDIIEKRFPALKSHPPRIVACQRADFEGSTIGDFNSNSWLVRSSTDSGFPLEILIAHELGHAMAALNGEVNGQYRGHNEIWIRTMIQSGYADEAKRTAELTHIYPGLDRVFKVVLLEEQKKAKRQFRSNGTDIISLFNARPRFADWLLTPID